MKMKTQKKKLLTTALILVLAIVAAACGGNAGGSADPNRSAGGGQAAAKDKLRVAYHPNMGGSSAIITGIKKGFFEEHNLDIELVKFTSGPTEIAAMVSGDIDLGYVGHGAHFLAIQGKVDIIALDVLSNAEEILVNKNAGVTKIEELKGKSVATQLGTSGDILLELALKRAGMTKNDIKLVNMDMAGAVSAFIANKVDAVAVWSPYSFEIKKAMGDRALTLADSMSFKDEFVFPASWIATPGYIAKHEDKVVRFLKGLNKSMDYRAEHLDEVVGLVAELNATPIDSVMLEKETGEWLSGKQAQQYFHNGTAKKWYEQQQKLFLNNGTIDKEVPVEDYVAFELIKKGAIE